MKFGKNKFLIISAMLCLMALVVMFLSLAFGKKQVQGQFVPPAFDEQAKSGIPQVPEALGWAELDAKVFRVSVCGVVAPSDGAADIWLTNPADNDVWLKLRILTQDGGVLGGNRADHTGTVHTGNQAGHNPCGWHTHHAQSHGL